MKPPSFRLLLNAAKGIVLPPKRVSKKGRAFIERREGCVLHPYNDSKNNATIGVGHLIHHGPVTADDKHKYRDFSKADADALLRQDLAKFEACVRRYVKPSIRLQHRFDAVVSLVFNIGCGAFEGSTLLRLLNQGKRGKPAADQFLRWNKPPELKRRRQLERSLYLQAKYD